MRESPALVIVSIDTEEDNWYRSRQDVTVQNIGNLRRLARFFDRLGVRPTYFTAYPVAVDSRAADVMREVCGGGRGELAAHLHPWNTPPLTEAFIPRHSMLKNLPAEMQLAKLERLTAAPEEAFEFRPTTFRAGRYGLGPETVAALLRCGYRVDSSVAPFVNLEPVDDGPSFVGAPMVPYRLAPDRDIREPAPNGTLVEIPMSYGFSRAPFSFWHPTRRLLEARPGRWLYLPGLAHRTGLLKRIALSPEQSSTRDMLTLSRCLLEQGVRHLQLFWHSPSLMPGLGHCHTAADVDRLYSSVEAYLEGLARMTSLTFVTVSEAASLLPPDMPSQPAAKSVAC